MEPHVTTLGWSNGQRSKPRVNSEGPSAPLTAGEGVKTVVPLETQGLSPKHVTVGGISC